MIRKNPIFDQHHFPLCLLIYTLIPVNLQVRKIAQTSVCETLYCAPNHMLVYNGGNLSKLTPAIFSEFLQKLTRQSNHHILLT